MPKPEIDRRIGYDCLAFGKLLERNARFRGDQVGVIAPTDTGDARLTWRAFDRYANRVANTLGKSGISRGDRVSTLLGNALALVGLYGACAKLGAPIVPMSPLLKAAAVASLARDAEPKAIVSTQSRAATLDDVRATLGASMPSVLFADGDRADDAGAPLPGGWLHDSADDAPSTLVGGDDVMTIMYTSGTTGAPKGIVHTHFIRAMYATLMANAWRMTPESVVLHSGSLVFNGAMVTMLPAMMLGATFIVHRAFDPAAFVDTVVRERVTHTMLVPSQIVAILEAPSFDPAHLASLSMLLSLGAPLHREHKERLEALLPGRLHELYGLTEGLVTILDRDDVHRKPGSVGVPPPFYELRIVDDDGNDVPAGTVGEIAGRGPITMHGYFGRDAESAQALRGGWLHSGDLGYVDDDGYLYLVDRKKDMIDSGGIKVYPRDIEEIAAGHPAVREVAVFGVPHPKWGETPLAAIVPRAGSVVSEDALRDWINARVAAQYQRVERVVLYDDFPRNAAGKTLKRELRAPFWEGRETKI